MPSEFRDPKTLAEWIELDYHQRSRWLRRWQTWLTLGTLLIGGAAAAVYALMPRASESYQAGSLSAAHALFSNDCRQCHTNAFQTTQRFVDPNAATVPDEACKACHAGPLHNKDAVRDSERVRCAECHHEHHGRDFLARVADSECTACHGQLKAHSQREGGAMYQDVLAFPAHHPLEARSGRTDPGRLRFNHKKHMASDLVVIDRGEGPKHLDCIDCHRSDDGSIVAGVEGKPARFQLGQSSPLGDAGQYMQPIRYEKHCKACHPLSVQLSGVLQGEEAKQAGEEFRKRPLPHPGPGQNTESVRGVIRDRLFDLVSRDHLAREVPADRPGIPRPAFEDTGIEAWTLVQKAMSDPDRLLFSEEARKVETSQFQLSGGCRYCHGDEMKKQPPDAQAWPEVAHVKLPERWWEHARFNHKRHRMMQCIECHGDAMTSEKTSDVLVPTDLNLCARCHSADARGSAAARHDCIECHRYHPHERSDPEKPSTLGELLRN
jgi:hypothetical protein